MVGFKRLRPQYSPGHPATYRLGYDSPAEADSGCHNHICFYAQQPDISFSSPPAKISFFRKKELLIFDNPYP
jgi:hypothetical protein